MIVQNAAYGTYRNGQILLDESMPLMDESKVIVVFLKDAPKKENLLDIFDVCGAWEDDRGIDTIIADTYSSRTARRDVSL